MSIALAWAVIATCIAIAIEALLMISLLGCPSTMGLLP